jgi:mitochondrial division protein 1
MTLTAHEQLLRHYLTAADVVSTHETTSPKDSPSSSSDPQDADLKGMLKLLASQARLLALRGRNLGPEGDLVKLDLVLKRLENVSSVAMAKFYAYRHDLVPQGWRHLYTDALILKSFHSFISSASGEMGDGVLDAVVESLDRALIITGGQGRTLGPRWIEETLRLLEEMIYGGAAQQERLTKGRRLVEDGVFSSQEPYGRPDLRQGRECRRFNGWTLDVFEGYMNHAAKPPEPIIFEDLLSDWPAMTDSPWNSMEYLLSKTLDGRRLVPVEVGRSYVDEGWGQELIKFGDFLQRYITRDPVSDGGAQDTGYLAQHELLRQIPSLRNDTQTPDFCWADVPRHPTDSSRDQAKVDAPQVNAWLGPARTITPLHCDGYHNLLCQVVGTKYVRLYPPSATPHMRPRASEHGVDMSNTSALDLGVIEGWDDEPDMEQEDKEEKEEDWSGLSDSLNQLEYRECILGPGDTLLIPIGWWHYVRSLSVSFSVSFWWN